MSNGQVVLPADEAFTEWLSAKREGLALLGRHYAIWGLDLGDERVYFSPKWFEIVGLPNTQFLTIAEWRLRVHPDDVRRAEDALGAYLRGETDRYEVEFRIRHRDGHSIWVLSTGIDICREGGEAKHVLGAITDISSYKTQEEALRNSKERTELLLSAIPDMTFILDSDGIFRDLHIPDPKLLRMPSEHYLGKHFRVAIHPSIVHAVEQAFDAATQTGEYQIYEVTSRGSDGVLRVFEHRVATSATGGFVIVARDVTKERDAEHEIAHYRDICAGIAENLYGLVFAFDVMTGKTLFLNAPMTWDAEGLRFHDDLISLFHVQDRVPYLRSYDELLAGQQDGPEQTYRLRTSEGAYRWYQLRQSILATDDHGRVTKVLVAGQDVSSQKEAEARLAAEMQDLQTIREDLEKRQSELEESNRQLGSLAQTDGLTGLYNHRTFRALLDQEIARARRYGTALSLMMMDLDHFKGYNDSHGHPAGDILLEGIATLLKDTCRSGDVIARYGGEEFAIIMPHTGSAESQAIAERLRIRIQETAVGREPVTASFGLACWFEGIDRDGILAIADRALYRSKEAGRNCVSIGRR